MPLRVRLPALLFALLAASSGNAESVRLVLGSFESVQRAEAWREHLSERHGFTIELEQVDNGMHRVLGPAMSAGEARRLAAVMEDVGVDSWPLLVSAASTPPPALSAVLTPHPAAGTTESPALAAATVQHSASARSRRAAPVRKGTRELDLQLGLESRSFFQSGVSGQASWHPSLSLSGEYFASDAADRWSLTLAPFLRFDAEDSERTHADLREGFVSRIGTNWEAHIGVRQVFWGVTEFSHLVDIINQTDLVENIDGEDKLGQPMLSASFVRDWGIVDAFVLFGHRERTFPGADGRLRTVLPVETDLTEYDDDREERRIDAALRWSQSFGALDLGVYHFSGTSREPILEPLLVQGGLRLRPRYTTIDQTGLDAQIITGDTAWKLEAMRRSGFGDSYIAANLGVEHTLIGVAGSRSDLGLVAEYLFDERGDDAFNTVFERDIALGTRWQLNDAANTHALLGVIWDPDTSETQISLEAGRQLGDGWSLWFEGRAFGGSSAADPAAPLPALLDPDAKLSSIVQDDYIHLELVRYF